MTKKTNTFQRPISPHIAIYKPQISSVLSIMHRFTGIGLFFGISTIVWWFSLWVFNKFAPEYLDLKEFWLVKAALMLCSFALFYHLSNGVRHLLWDSGYCFSINEINLTGWLVVVLSLTFTVIFWCFV